MGTEAETGVMRREAKECQGLAATTRSRGSRKGFYPGSDSMALMTPRFQSSNLQHSEKINSCYLKPPGLWHFVTVALGNW